ncbi:MAG: phage holin [Acetatifactor sp.]
MDSRLFEIILALIPVLGAVITYFIVPYIRTNIDAARLAQYKEWAGLAVKTAEMLWRETGHGEDKKAYVVNFLTDMFNSRKIVITEEQMNVLIESAVKEMKEITST